MADTIDYGPMFQQAPQSGASQGLSRLSSVLDAIMQRKSLEAQHKAQLEQAAKLAAIDDARMQQQADQTLAHNTAEEDIARKRLEQEGADREQARRTAALPKIQGALDAGDMAAAQLHAQGTGYDVHPTAAPIPMNLLDTVKPQASPDDPLAPSLPSPPQGEEGAMGGRPSGTQPSAMPSSPMNPLQAQQQAQTAAPPPAPSTYDISAPGQQPITYDPGAARVGALASGKELSGDLGALSGGSPYDARALADVQRMAQTGALKTKDEAIKAFNDRAKFYELQAEENKRAQINAGAKVAAFAKPDTGARLDLNSLRAEFKDWKKTTGIEKMIQGGFNLKSALANIDATGPRAAVAHKDAQVQLAKYFRGNVPTDSEMHLLYDNLGGKLGNGWSAFLARMETGDLTPVELGMVKESIRIAHAEYVDNLKRIHESGVSNFGPGSGYENMATNVNTMVGAAFKAAGYSMPDVYSQATSGVTLKGGAGGRKAPTVAKSSPKSLADMMRGGR